MRMHLKFSLLLISDIRLRDVKNRQQKRPLERPFLFVIRQPNFTLLQTGVLSAMRVSGTNPAGVSMRFLSSKKRFKPKNLFSSRCHEIQAGITDNPIPTIIYTVAAIVSGISSSEKILGEYCSKTKG